MMLERQDPFRNFAVFQDAFGRLFGEEAGKLDATRGSSSWQPPVDVYEDPERLTFRFDVPGVKKEELNVRVENQVLTVEGQRGFENEQKRSNYHRVERVYGKFARSFSLPATIAPEQVEAELKDGVLSVTLPKRPEAQPRSVQIR